PSPQRCNGPGPWARLRPAPGRWTHSGARRPSGWGPAPPTTPTRRARVPRAASRSETTECLARAPEPPLYPRADDPARAHAAELLAEGIGLLGRGWALQQAARLDDADVPLVRAVQAHAEALAST